MTVPAPAMRWHHIGMALLVNLLFGFNFIASKVGVDHFGPMLFLTLRFLGVGLLLAPFLRVMPGRMASVVKVALCIGVAHFGFTFIGTRLASGASSVALVSQLQVPFAIILAVVLLKEAVDRRRLIGMVLAFAGVVIIGFDPDVLAHIVALPFLIIGAFAIALGTVLIPATRGIPILTLQAWIATIALPFLLLGSLVFESAQITTIASASPIEWAMLAFVAIGSSVIAHGTWYHLLKLYPVSMVSPFSLLAPVFGVALSAALLGDALTPEIIVGGVLVLAGIALIQLKRQAARASATSADAP